MKKLLYRNYNDEKTYTDIAEFAHERANMVAPLLGGARDVAIEYTWSVSDDGGASFRSPTSAEQDALYKAIWDSRASALDCSRDCQLRGRFDGIWRCMTCSAVWTSPEDGASYGAPLTPSQVRREIEDRGLEDPEALSVADEYEARIKEARQDRLIMAVQSIQPHSYRFLVFCTEGGSWYVRWARTL